MKCISIPTAMLLAAMPALLGAQELAADSVTPPSAVMTPAKPDPEVAAAQIVKELKDSKDVSAADINVSTHAGTLVLTGEVNSEAERVAANSIAEQATKGVRVSNSIEVRPVEELPVKDQHVSLQATRLVRDVEAALAADSRTRNLGIAVTSADGKVVVLQGLVPSRNTRTAIQAVASKVKGVAQVDNRVVVP